MRKDKPESPSLQDPPSGRLPSSQTYLVVHSSRTLLLESFGRVDYPNSIISIHASNSGKSKIRTHLVLRLRRRANGSLSISGGKLFGSVSGECVIKAYVAGEDIEVNHAIRGGQ